MHLRATLAALLLSCTLTACTRSPDAPTSEDRRLHPTSRPAYYEVKHEGAIYILGNMASFDRARNGQMPARTVRRNSRGGVPLYFEANDSGMQERLMAEYDRRHGLSQ